MAYYSKYSGKEVDERLDRVDSIPTKISQLLNDKDYITGIELKAILDRIPIINFSDIPIDEDTIYWEEGVLKSKGGTGDSNWVIKKDPEGKSYLYTELPVVTKYDITMYSHIYDDINIFGDFAIALEGMIDKDTIIMQNGKLMVNPDLNIGGGSSGYWQLKTDERGTTYLYSPYDVVSSRGITMYAEDTSVDIPSIYEGLPIDNNTIIRGTEGELMVNPDIKLSGGASTWDELEGKPTFATVATSGKYADLSGLPDLSVYATKEYLTTELKKYVTIDGNEAINGLKNFTKGLQIDGLGITKSQDDVIYLDANLVVRGGITMFGTNSVDVPTIMDAIATDNINLKVVDGVLTFVGSSGGGLTEVYWDDVIGKPTLLSSFIDDVVDGHYLPLSGGQMTGGISYPLVYMGNIRDLASSCVFDYTDSTTAKGALDNKRSLMGCAHNVTSDRWWNIISVRGDSDKYGMYICSSMTDYQGNLFWNKQEGYEGAWQGERVILDSVNWRNYVTLGGNPTYDGVLTVNGSDVRGSYPAIRLHIPNVNWQQFLMRGDGIIELRGGGNDQLGAWGKLALGQLFFDEQRDNVLYFPGKEYFDNHGNIHIPNADGSWSWNIYNSNGSNVMTVYTNGFTILGGGLSVNAATSRPSLGYLSGGMLSVGINGLYGTHIWTEGSGAGCIQVGRSDGSATAYMLAIQPLGGETHICGNLLTYGGITMYSDIRKKTKLQDVELTLQQVADAPLIEHYYNSDTNKTTHVGSIAQYWASMNDWFCKLDNDGFYTMEIQNAALASAISIARELVKYESKTDRKIRLLKKRVKELEDKIKKYEKN